jgi:replication factor C subunit 3/5
VHACTGKPLPADVKSILDMLLNKGFKEAMDGVSALMVSKGISLMDMVTHLHEIVLLVQFAPEVLQFLLEKMADVEYRLAADANERIQLGALVGCFQISGNMILKAAAS